MSEFDLDAQVNTSASTVSPAWKSKSLCTPGCITGILHCTTRNCNITNGCSITK